MSRKSPIKLLSGFLVLLVILLSWAGMGFAQTNVTPEQHLALQARPKFKPGHTLPPLTYTGWGSENSNTMVELANNWGYAVEFDAVTPYSVKTLLATPGYKQHGLAQLVKADPDKFKAVVHCIKHFSIPEYLPPQFTNLMHADTRSLFSKSSFATNSSGEYLDPQGNASPYFNYIVSTNGVTNNFNPVFSTHMPAADWELVTAAQIELFKMFNSNTPISIVINDGEWGMYEYSSHWRAWHKDPRFVAEMAGLGVAVVPDVYNTDPRLHYFVAQQKGRELSFLAKAVATNFPGAFYYWYKTDMEKFRLYGRVAGTDYGTNYVNGSNFDSRYTVTNFALPICESYFWSANSGLTNGYNNYGININQTSLLLQFENWAGFMVSQVRPLSYNYVSAGWERNWLTALTGTSYISHESYLGLLKCFYTLGMIGGNAGNYENNATDFNAPFAPTAPPQWLTQKMALARVHAQFSWLEDYLRNGTLVAGPYTNLLSTDRMSYDFNQGTNGANKAHVFVRKLNASDNWLITAWTADTTPEELPITIPQLGPVTITARPEGSVYRATTSSLILQDPDGLLPTEKLRLRPPGNVRVESATTE
jgi:hypothetical protein